MIELVGGAEKSSCWKLIGVILLIIACQATSESVVSDAFERGYVTADEFAFPSYELNALYALYNSTGGPSWHWESLSQGNIWNFSVPSPNPCTQQWQGVTCTSLCASSPCHVQELSLYLFGMQGPLPPELGVLGSLVTLELSDNVLTGTIPPQLGNLSNLMNIDLSYNNLTGTIPATLGNSSLVSLSLGENQLTGTIPREIFLPSLLEFVVEQNRLNGTIPSEIGNAIQLFLFNINTNDISGTIPVEIGSLSQLNYFIAASGRLTGPIPKEMGNLFELETLYLPGNNLTGTIPPQLGNLSKLEDLQLEGNSLSGKIPPQLGNLSLMFDMSLSNNQLTGTIPPELGNFPSISGLHLIFNRLTGTIPATLGQLRSLFFLELDFNKLRGTIPPELGNLTKLTNLNLASNELTGTIPRELEQLRNLVTFDLHGNQLKGGVSIDWSQLPKLSSVSLAANQLTGPITAAALTGSPLVFVNISNNGFTGAFCDSQVDNTQTLHRLQVLDLSNNFLTGTLTACITGAQNLQVLVVKNNSFSGELQGVLENTGSSQTYFSQLQVVDVSQNQFTGSLPALIFSNGSKIQAFVASENCLSGSLPSSLCDAVDLNSLVLDGMSTAPSCQHALFPQSSALVRWLNWHAYGLVQQDQAGSLLSCLFNLPHLQTLHLAGLGLTGSIPDGNLSAIHAYDGLQYLSLSYNQLTGTIPSRILEYSGWKELDLSFNRLVGTLPPSTATLSDDAVLRLNINFLSGSIPSALMNVDNITVLDGNMFACRVAHSSSELPQHDSDAETYGCGSNETNSVLIVWTVLLTLLTLVLAVIITKRYISVQFTSLDTVVIDIMRTLLLSASEDNTDNNVNLEQFPHWHHLWTTCLNNARTFIFYCSTCVVGYLLCLLLPLYCILTVFYGTYTHQYVWTASAAFLSGTVPAVLMFLCWLGLGTLLLSWWWRQTAQLKEPLQSVDINHPQAQVQEENGLIQDSSRVWVQRTLLIVFVLFTAAVIITANASYIFALQQQLPAAELSLVLIAFATFKLAANWMIMRLVPLQYAQIILGLLIFNSVFAPYSMQSFVSSQCFSYATFSQTPSVTSTYLTEACTVAVNLNFNSSSTVSYEQVINCPLTTTTTTYSPPFLYSYTCSSSLVKNFIWVFVLRYTLSGLVYPVVLILARKLLATTSSELDSVRWMVMSLLPRRWRLREAVLQTESSSQVILQDLPPPDAYHQAFFTLPILNDTLVLLTFGVLFPLLGLLILVSMQVHVADYFLSLQLLIGVANKHSRHQYHGESSAMSEQRLSLTVQVTERELRTLSRQLLQPLPRRRGILGIHVV